MNNSDLCKIDVQFIIRRRWIKMFFRMLNCLKWCSKTGASRNVCFYADGDGDFKFDFIVNGKQLENDLKFYDLDDDRVNNNQNLYIRKNKKADFFFDAG